MLNDRSDWIIPESDCLRLGLAVGLLDGAVSGDSETLRFSNSVEERTDV